MTSFFVGGRAARGASAEAVYSELRERSLQAVGCPARARRIFKLGCRFDGADREIEVGKPLGDGGEVVLAILDHGRFEAFSVYSDNGSHSEPARVNHPVYSVTEFS
jgi:hypothetical protein